MVSGHGHISFCTARGEPGEFYSIQPFLSSKAVQKLIELNSRHVKTFAEFDSVGKFWTRELQVSWKFIQNTFSHLYHRLHLMLYTSVIITNKKLLFLL